LSIEGEIVAAQVRITNLANNGFLGSSESTSVFQNISDRGVEKMAPNKERLPIPCAHHMTGRLL
jgi:hypothetical protein